MCCDVPLTVVPPALVVPSGLLVAESQNPPVSQSLHASKPGMIDLRIHQTRINLVATSATVGFVRFTFVCNHIPGQTQDKPWLVWVKRGSEAAKLMTQACPGH